MMQHIFMQFCHFAQFVFIQPIDIELHTKHRNSERERKQSKENDEMKKKRIYFKVHSAVLLLKTHSIEFFAAQFVINYGV